MWELDLKKVEHWRIWTVVLEKTLESPLDCKEIQPLNSTWTNYFQMFKVDFKKAGEPEIKLPTSAGSSKKQEFKKNIYFCFIDYAKRLTLWITTNCGKFFKRWEYRTTWPASWEICMHVKKQQLKLDMEQQTCSKSGKEYIKSVYCHPGYLTYLQSTSEKVMATHSSTLAWRIPWTEEPRRLQSMGLLRVGHDWVTSLSLFTFMYWRRKWQPTPVFLPGESQGWGSLVGCCLWGPTELDTTEVT